MSKKFITFEGIDGCGKTTIATKVYEKLIERNLPVILTTEPTKSWLGDTVKRSYSENVSPYTEVFLFLADRAEHVVKIKKWLAEGNFVISDRYCDSTYAYQAAIISKQFRFDALKWLVGICERFVLKPDITFLLIIKPDDALKRIAYREKSTKFEDIALLREVTENYLRLSEMEDRFVKLDATKNVDELTEEVLSHLMQQ
jgi:dTMP kinase